VLRLGRELVHSILRLGDQRTRSQAVHFALTLVIILSRVGASLSGRRERLYSCVLSRGVARRLGRPARRRGRRGR
jgi:hypothetical protein